jgi:CRP-like cAMP-binding protein
MIPQPRVNAIGAPSSGATSPYPGKAGRPEGAAGQIPFPLSRQDIAEMTGTTLHTVSRILSAWEQRGLVDGGRMRVVIREPETLLAIADDLRLPDPPT